MLKCSGGRLAASSGGSVASKRMFRGSGGTIDTDMDLPFLRMETPLPCPSRCPRVDDSCIGLYQHGRQKSELVASFAHYVVAQESGVTHGASSPTGPASIRPSYAFSSHRRERVHAGAPCLYQQSGCDG